MAKREVLLSRIWTIFSNMTVEPMLFAYILGSVVAGLATQNLNLNKACRVNLNYSDQVCSALERRDTANYTKEEEAIQKLVASMSIWKTLIQSSLPAVLILFYGSWSDRWARRRPCMIVPMAGEFLTQIGLILCTYFFYEVPMEVAGFTEAIFPAITGGWMTMVMAVFSYIADRTSVEDRTWRVAIVSSCSSFSVPIGMALSGILYKKIGYYGVFSLSASLSISCVFYCIFILPEDKIPTDKKPEKERNLTCFGFLKDFFDPSHIKDTFAFVFKKGAHNRRMRVILLMIAVIVIFGPMHGEPRTIRSRRGGAGGGGAVGGAATGSPLSPQPGDANMVESKDRTSVFSAVRGFYLSMTVEPMLAWYIIGSVVAILATQNLNLEKACRVNLKFGDEVCTALERRETANYTKEEQAVQQLVASMAIWKTLVQSAVPAFLILFLGSWSDRRGRRKPCMLLPITGEFMTAIGLILCTYFFYELPMEVAGITEAIFPAFTGGWMTMFMAVFSYMGDITSLETRTLRIGIVNVCSSISVPIGTAVSGILYKKIGYYGVFSLSASIYILSFFYGYYKIPEEKKPSVPNEKISLEDEVKPGIIGFFRDFFDLQHIKDTISVAFKSGANNRRKRVMLLMIVVIVVFGPMHGEMTVMYLFTRYRFNWNEVDYSIFNTYSMVTNLIGTAISVGVFSHMLKIDDAIIGVISCMSKILAGFVFAFATTTTMIYIAPLVDIVNGTSFIAMRSIASKLVPPDELGKVNSVFGLAEAIVPVIYGPMYSAVYRATMNTVPGAFFLLGGALTAPAIVIFLWMYSEHKKDAARLARETAENEKSKEAADTKIEPEKELNGSAIVTKDTSISYSNKGFEPDMTNSKV